ncbi:MAG: hypothetical protein AAGD34_17975, partial [Pseudomonadota bacterium]
RNKKKAAENSGLKSREETPKEGSDTRNPCRTAKVRGQRTIVKMLNSQSAGFLAWILAKSPSEVPKHPFCIIFARDLNGL